MPTPLSLEDQLPDILGKAQRGLRVDDRTLAAEFGVAPDALARLKQGDAGNDDALRAAADALGLHGDSLLAIGRGTWQPEAARTPDTFGAFNTPFGGGLSVNCFLVWDRPGGTAVLFDTGTDAAPIFRILESQRLHLDAVFLTHTHSDHIEALEEIVGRTGAEAFVPERERDAVPHAVPVTEGQRFTLGGVTLEARLTRGHTVGGLTYVVETVGFGPRLAVVGDALFAGSQGGVPAELYAEALRLNREHILSLPDDTILCPGHGPLSTVGEEKAHNPFYAK